MYIYSFMFNKHGFPCSMNLCSSYIYSIATVVAEFTHSFHLASIGNSDLYDVSNYLAALTESEVFVLSQALGLDGQTVSSFRNSPFFLDEVLMRWLQGKDEVMERGGHTWTALVKALREPVVDQHSIADKIEKETQSGHDSPEHP